MNSSRPEPPAIDSTDSRRCHRTCPECRSYHTPVGWVTGDEVYGAGPYLRADLERRQIGYVLAVSASHPVVTGAGARQARQIAACPGGRAGGRGSATPRARAPRAIATTTGPGRPSTPANPVSGGY